MYQIDTHVISLRPQFNFQRDIITLVGIMWGWGWIFAIKSNFPIGNFSNRIGFHVHFFSPARFPYEVYGDGKRDVGKGMGLKAGKAFDPTDELIIRFKSDSIPRLKR